MNHRWKYEVDRSGRAVGAVCDKCGYEAVGEIERNQARCSGHRVSPLSRPIPERVISRFWSKVDKSGANGCWIWTAGVQGDGYGQVGIYKEKIKAHRLSWLLQHGELPDGLDLLHSCDNRRCVNPGHLSAGTNAQNVADRVARGRSRGQWSRTRASGVAA